MFRVVLPKGCIVKAGDIPVALLNSVEVESATLIKFDRVHGVGIMAMADEKSIDSINNDPNNNYHKSRRK